MSLIQLTNISKIYPLKKSSFTALNQVNLCVEKGEMLAICGPSGSGKSTLLNMIGLLDRPTVGQYYFNGHDVSTYTDRQLAALRNQSIGFVFQSFFLMPRLTVLQNILLPTTYSKLKINPARASELLSQLHIAHLANHFPNQLSGGQQQRVAIARALIMQPFLILADEPTGALDAETSSEIMSIFAALHTASHTIIIITHDHKVSAQCQRVISINKEDRE